jgi:hypothetical protein
MVFQRFGSSFGHSLMLGAAPLQAVNVERIWVRSEGKRGKYRKYEPAQMAAALAAHKAGDTLQSAAEAHSVPYSTLQNRAALDEKGVQPKPPGRPTTLTFLEELLVITWMLVMAAVGFPARKRAIVDKAFAVANVRGAMFRSKNGKPGKRWWKNFRYRWRKQFAMNKASRLSAKKAKLTREQLNAWYDRLRWIMEFHKIRETDVFNLDETGLDREIGGTESVAVGAGSGRATKVCSDMAQHVTVLSTIRSNGGALPPFFLFRGKEGASVRTRWEYDPLDGCTPGSQFARTGTFVFLYDHLLLCADCFPLQRRPG